MIESFKTIASVAIVWKSLPSIMKAKTKKQIYSLLSYVWNWLWVLRKLPFSRLGKPRNRDCRFASFASRSNRLVVILRSHLSPKMSEIDGRLTYLVWNQSRFNTKDRLISTSCLYSVCFPVYWCSAWHIYGILYYKSNSVWQWGRV